MYIEQLLERNARKNVLYVFLFKTIETFEIDSHICSAKNEEPAFCDFVSSNASKEELYGMSRGWENKFSFRSIAFSLSTVWCFIIEKQFNSIFAAIIFLKIQSFIVCF